ncbi:MAG: bacillithiol biosynthesis BshC [Promethearchaeota archaeon]
MTTKLQAYELYYKAVFDEDSNATKFWGPIPRTIKDALVFSRQIAIKYQQGQQPIFSEKRVSELCATIEELHQNYSMLTGQVKGHLEQLAQIPAAVEAGHQPAVLGGPGFVLNKIATIIRLAKLQNSVPIMFVGDHDTEQKELTVIHLPSPGPSGIAFTLPISTAFQQSPLHMLPLPSEAWLKSVIQKIDSTYHELATTASRKSRQTYTERVEIIKSLLLETYSRASSLVDWVLRLWMQISNFKQECGVLFQRFSNPKIRSLMLPAYEYLLSSKNRLRFINAMNQASEQLRKLNYQPGIGNRSKDYVPFHIECPSQGCNRTRLEPVLKEQAKTSSYSISATCPKCKETHVIETSASNPDLSNWTQYLSPRVDTRAFLVQSFTPVILHVGGPGETSYHAQVLPGLSAIDSLQYIFFRYTRMFYDNPWTRRAALTLQNEKLPVLESGKTQFYKSAIDANYNEENEGVVRSLFAAYGEYITDTAKQLTDEEMRIEKERSKAVKTQRETSDQSTRHRLQAHIGLLTKHRQLLQIYQSQMFGRYAPERFGQEASFAWIDMAMSLGPKQVIDRLQNHYQLLTPPAAIFHIAGTT